MLSGKCCCKNLGAGRRIERGRLECFGNGFADYSGDHWGERRNIECSGSVTGARIRDSCDSSADGADWWSAAEAFADRTNCREGIGANARMPERLAIVKTGAECS